MTSQHDVTEATLREIMTMSGVHIQKEDYDEQLQRLRERLAATRDWEDRNLGFSFDENGFSYVHPAHVHRHRWDVSTPMNGNRTLDKNGVDSTDE